MEQNLELKKFISFDEFILHGLENGANVVNGMPLSWKINGVPITHENNNCYLIPTIDSTAIERFGKGQFLAAFEGGLVIFNDYGDSHAPNGCEM